MHSHLWRSHAQRAPGTLAGGAGRSRQVGAEEARASILLPYCWAGTGDGNRTNLTSAPAGWPSWERGSRFILMLSKWEKKMNPYFAPHTKIRLEHDTKLVRRRRKNTGDLHDLQASKVSAAALFSISTNHKRKGLLLAQASCHLRGTTSAGQPFFVLKYACLCVSQQGSKSKCFK